MDENKMALFDLSTTLYHEIMWCAFMPVCISPPYPHFSLSAVSVTHGEVWSKNVKCNFSPRIDLWSLYCTQFLVVWWNLKPPHSIPPCYKVSFCPVCPSHVCPGSLVTSSMSTTETSQCLSSGNPDALPPFLCPPAHFILSCKCGIPHVTMMMMMYKY